MQQEKTKQKFQLLLAVQSIYNISENLHDPYVKARKQFAGKIEVLPIMHIKSETERRKQSRKISGISNCAKTKKSAAKMNILFEIEFPNHLIILCNGKFYQDFRANVKSKEVIDYLAELLNQERVPKSTFEKTEDLIAVQA